MELNPHIPKPEPPVEEKEEEKKEAEEAADDNKKEEDKEKVITLRCRFANFQSSFIKMIHAKF